MIIKIQLKPKWRSTNRENPRTLNSIDEAVTAARETTSRRLDSSHQTKLISPDLKHLSVKKLCEVYVNTGGKGKEPKRREPCRSDRSRHLNQLPPGSLFTPLRRPQTESLLKYSEVHATISRPCLANLLPTEIHHLPKF